jgi:phosphoglycerate kinase
VSKSCLPLLVHQLSRRRSIHQFFQFDQFPHIHQFFQFHQFTQFNKKKMTTLKDIDLNGKKVLIRVDFNVPFDKEFNITDDTRIQAALPTIKYVLEQGGSPILMSHLGRPQKKKKDDGSIDVQKFTLRHVAGHLGGLLDGATLKFAENTVGEETQRYAKELQPGEVLLLENTRFEAGEEKGDIELAKQLAQLGSVYVNDAFGSAHRAHASTTTVAQFFDPKHRAFGLLMEKEIKNATKALNSDARPITAITGGAKVSDKLLLLESLLDRVDHLIIGGGMAYTFVKAQGGSIGNSIFEEDKMDLTLELLEKAKAKGVEVHLPVDTKIADDFSNDANAKVVPTHEIPDNWEGLDIGPKTIEQFGEVIKKSKTILWNGPMGVFEFENFATGTESVAEFVAAATRNGAFSLIGGGDSVAAVTQMGLVDDVSFASTGGGAMLEFLEGKTLPGIAAIEVG